MKTLLILAASLLVFAHSLINALSAILPRIGG
jgi:hypothetical protein